MVLSIGERIKGFLFSPSETFDNSKDDTIGDAFKYFVVILMIYALIISVLIAVTFSLFAAMLGMLGIPMMALWAAMGSLFAVVFFILMLVSGIIGVFIGGLWLHIWVYLLGGREGVEETLKAVMYGATPGCLFGWIPLVGLIWAVIVEIIGVRQLHELSTGKAVLAVIIAIAIPLIIYAVIIAALFMATMLGALRPEHMIRP